MQQITLKRFNLFSCDTLQTHLCSCFMVDMTNSTKNNQIKKAQSNEGLGVWLDWSTSLSS